MLVITVRIEPTQNAKVASLFFRLLTFSLSFSIFLSD